MIVRSLVMSILLVGSSYCLAPGIGAEFIELSLYDNECCHAIRKYKQSYGASCFCSPRKGDKLFYAAGRDILSLFAHLWDWDTIKVLVGVFPAFISARMIDEKVQKNFFCHNHHKNCNQFPNWCHDVVRVGLGIPIAALGSQVFLSRDIEMRYTSWMLLLGMPFLIFGKDVIKNFDAECCLRPWHENFCQKHKRAGGGFPSGHMAQAVYIAALYGGRFGAEFAIPLGAFAAGLGVIFINCNRHYTSQIIAGAGLGAIFAMAANKVIDRRLSDRCSVGLCCDSTGAPSFGLSWLF